MFLLMVLKILLLICLIPLINLPGALVVKLIYLSLKQFGLVVKRVQIFSLFLIMASFGKLVISKPWVFIFLFTPKLYLILIIKLN